MLYQCIICILEFVHDFKEINLICHLIKLRVILQLKCVKIAKIIVI